MLKKTAIIASVVALAFVGLVGCSGGGEQTGATPSPEITGSPAATEASPATETSPATEASPAAEEVTPSPVAS